MKKKGKTPNKPWFKSVVNLIIDQKLDEAFNKIKQQYGEGSGLESLNQAHTRYTEALEKNLKNRGTGVFSIVPDNDLTDARSTFRFELLTFILQKFKTAAEQRNGKTKDKWLEQHSQWSILKNQIDPGADFLIM